MLTNNVAEIASETLITSSSTVLDKNIVTIHQEIASETLITTWMELVGLKEVLVG